MTNKRLELLHYSMVETSKMSFAKHSYVIPTFAGVTQTDKKILLGRTMENAADVIGFRAIVHTIMAVNNVVAVSIACGAVYSKQGNPVDGVGVITWDKAGVILRDCFKMETATLLVPIDVPAHEGAFSTILSPIEVTPEMVEMAQAYKKEDWYIEGI